MDVDGTGFITLAAGVDAWYSHIPQIQFGAGLWQRASVFPTRANTLPAKVTILEEDWEIDEWGNGIVWVRVKNLGPNPVEFILSTITLPQ